MTGSAVVRLRDVEMDDELLGRLRHGDEEAFVMLVARYQQPMLRLARSMAPDSDLGRRSRPGHLDGCRSRYRPVRRTLNIEDLVVPDSHQPGTLDR